MKTFPKDLSLNWPRGAISVHCILYVVPFSFFRPITLIYKGKKSNKSIPISERILLSEFTVLVSKWFRHHIFFVVVLLHQFTKVKSQINPSGK